MFWLSFPDIAMCDNNPDGSGEALLLGSGNGKFGFGPTLMFADSNGKAVEICKSLIKVEKISNFVEMFT